MIFTISIPRLKQARHFIIVIGTIAIGEFIIMMYMHNEARGPLYKLYL